MSHLLVTSITQYYTDMCKILISTSPSCRSKRSHCTSARRFLVCSYSASLSVFVFLSSSFCLCLLSSLSIKPPLVFYSIHISALFCISNSSFFIYNTPCCYVKPQATHIALKRVILLSAPILILNPHLPVMALWPAGR